MWGQVWLSGEGKLTYPASEANPVTVHTAP